MYFLVLKGLGNKYQNQKEKIEDYWKRARKTEKEIQRRNKGKKYIRRIKVETLSITIWHRVFKLFVKLLKRQGGDKKN